MNTKEYFRSEPGAEIVTTATCLADIQQLESHMKQREQENRDPLVGQLQQMIDSFQSSSDQLANTVTANVRLELQHQLQMMVGK